MNPLFARELRLRWRDRRAWWLLLALALALALLAGFLFQSGVSRADQMTMVRLPNGTYTMRALEITPSARAARSGRELFTALAIGNVVAWLLIAPLLTATPIARERERGLLESLQLSHMTPLSQIAARTGAALIFLLLLQGAVTPIYAVIAWLGGVSPGELGLAALVIVSTAIGGAALGTWISARSHRPSSALFSALGTIVLWTLLLMPAVAGVSLPGANWWFYPAAALFWTHPLPLIYRITDADGQMATRLSPPMGWEIGPFSQSVCALWLLASFILLALSVRLIRHALAPASWGPQASAPVEWWQRSLRAREQKALERQSARKSVGRRVEGALVASLPLESLARFSDPLLAREVRGRFRLRRGGAALMLGRLLLFGAGVFCFAWAVFSLNDPPSRPDVSAGLLYILWGLGALAIGALSSSGFARERESGTWEGLKLSLLSPREITRAKWLSPLISFGYYSAPLWFLLPFGAAIGAHSGLDPLQLVLGAGIVLASLGTLSMFGLLISWRIRQPNAALGWTLGLGLVLLLAVPIAREASDFDNWASRRLFGLAVYRQYGNTKFSPEERRVANIRTLSHLWHPVESLGHVLDPHTNERDDDGDTLPNYVALLVQLAVFVVVVSGGTWYLKRAIARDSDAGAG